ncbi:GNAT family N-acetyltransferase [Aquimarina sp. D1M17]|uniref:GNAT family N-acetyltransferase n=1 Tax=Aquimarina acroporae TaxID=2937283 RepID=UPI0020C1629E|nr:GNAT family N-acetyltransferase [Aquimarina acroporae]MCK8521793.1 GNAT family N-acetyltransferase [Aquimarina acroporae]
MQESNAIQHQFEFWEYLGQVGGYLHHNDAYLFLAPKNATWPSKTFGLNEDKIDFEQLKIDVKKGTIPGSIALQQNNELENKLLKHGFKKTSTVEGMVLHIDGYSCLDEYDDDIIEVTTIKEVDAFAKISSKAFGYTIYSSTLEPLLRGDKVKLYIGKYQGNYVSCGIVFKDHYGNSGLHMIGALPEFRGLGLGKIMTKHLLSRAIRNKSKKVYLVASKLGTPIYDKLGFQNQGYLQSYTV